MPCAANKVSPPSGSVEQLFFMNSVFSGAGGLKSYLGASRNDKPREMFAAVRTGTGYDIVVVGGGGD